MSHIPFSENIPNEKTIAAMEELKNNAGEEGIILNDIPGVHHVIYPNGLYIGDKLNPNVGGYIPRNPKKSEESDIWATQIYFE